jgi:hypothetical protein
MGYAPAKFMDSEDYSKSYPEVLTLKDVIQQDEWQ